MRQQQNRSYESSGHVPVRGGHSRKGGLAANDVAEVRKYVNPLRQVLHIIGVEVGDRCFSQSVLHLTEISKVNGVLSISTLIKVLKWKLAAFMAALIDNPLPERFDSVRNEHAIGLFGGKFFRYVLSLKKKAVFCKKSRRMLYTLGLTVLNSKKGMPRPSKEVCDIELSKTFVDLTTPVQVPRFFQQNETRCGREVVMIMSRLGQNTVYRELDSKQQELFHVPFLNSSFLLSEGLRNLTHERVKEELARTVREVITKEGLNLKKLSFPSTSATYYSSRNNLGAVADVMDFIRDTYSGPVMKEEMREKLDRIAEGLLPEVNTLGDRPALLSDVTLLDSLLEDLNEDIKHDLEIMDYRSVELVALPEALKVRIISKGNGLKATLLKPLQQHLHSCLRRLPCFRLVGQPESAAVVTEAFSRFSDGSWSFHSGDYSAATNELFSFASRAVVDTICDVLELDPELSDYFMDDLVGNEIVKIGESRKVTEKGGKVVKLESEYTRAKQVRGQLMGAITSFPVLCIVNAALTRMVCEWDRMCKISLADRDCGILINGDDVAVAYRCSEFPRYKAIVTSFVGLRDSIGKVYNSPASVNINSRFFLLEDREFWQVPFVNAGLLYGLKRSGGKVSESDEFFLSGFDIATQFREFLETAPAESRTLAHTQFIKTRGLELKRLRPIPWYIPKELGGLGLPSYRSSEVLLSSRTLLPYKDFDIMPVDMISNLPEDSVASRFDELRANYILKNGVRVPNYTLPPDWLMREFSDEVLRTKVDLTANRLVSEDVRIRKEFFGFQSQRTELFFASQEEQKRNLEHRIDRLSDRLISLHRKLNDTQLAIEVEARRRTREEEKIRGLQLREQRLKAEKVELSDLIEELRSETDVVLVRHVQREQFRTALAWVLLFSRSLGCHVNGLPTESHVLHRSELDTAEVSQKTKKQSPAVRLAAKKLSAQRKFWAEFKKTDNTSVDDIYKRYRTEEEWLFCPITLKYL